MEWKIYFIASTGNWLPDENILARGTGLARFTPEKQECPVLPCCESRAWHWNGFWHSRGNRRAIYSLLLHSTGHASVPGVSSASRPFTEPLRLQKPSKAEPKLGQHCSVHHYTSSQVPQPHFSHFFFFFLSISMDGDSTMTLGSLFQCLITLPMKNLLLISVFNLPWYNLRTFCLILSLVTWDKTSTPTSLPTPSVLL